MKRRKLDLDLQVRKLTKNIIKGQVEDPNQVVVTIPMVCPSCGRSENCRCSSWRYAG